MDNRIVIKSLIQSINLIKTPKGKKENLRALFIYICTEEEFINTNKEFTRIAILKIKEIFDIKMLNENESREFRLYKRILTKCLEVNK